MTGKGMGLPEVAPAALSRDRKEQTNEEQHNADSSASRARDSPQSTVDCWMSKWIRTPAAAVNSADHTAGFPRVGARDRVEILEESRLSRVLLVRKSKISSLTDLASEDVNAGEEKATSSVDFTAANECALPPGPLVAEQTEESPYSWVSKWISTPFTLCAANTDSTAVSDSSQDAPNARTGTLKDGMILRFSEAHAFLIC